MKSILANILRIRYVEDVLESWFSCALSAFCGFFFSILPLMQMQKVDVIRFSMNTFSMNKVNRSYSMHTQ